MFNHYLELMFRDMCLNIFKYDSTFVRRDFNKIMKIQLYYMRYLDLDATVRIIGSEIEDCWEFEEVRGNAIVTTTIRLPDDVVLTTKYYLDKVPTNMSYRLRKIQLEVEDFTGKHYFEEVNRC